MIMAWHKEQDSNLMVRMSECSAPLFKTIIEKCCKKFRLCHAFISFLLLKKWDEEEQVKNMPQNTVLFPLVSA